MGKLAILDGGAQFGKVIDRRVRSHGVESIILPIETKIKELLEFDAFIITGGPESVYSDSSPKFDPELFNLGKPVLGICYGMQLLNFYEGGSVEKLDIREEGQDIIDIETRSKLFKGMDTKQNVLLTHGDSITKLGNGFTSIAKSSNGIISAIENKDKALYGVQFHPEVDLTDNGPQVFKNFLYDICEFDGSFTLEDREQRAIREIREKVGNKKVLVLVSGGVDSTVCSALLNKAIGAENVYAIHIDNGFMRLDESKKVVEALEKLGMKIIHVDGSEVFYNATTEIEGKVSGKLKDTLHPEDKRYIIGDTFMTVLQAKLEEIGLSADEVFFAQGTLRPDLIESASALASGRADKIKTHHNDTPLVRELREKGKVIEPLSDLHKDEVRVLGRILGLPEEIVERQPFPGPGLAVRIICLEEPVIGVDFDETNNMLKELLNFNGASDVFVNKIKQAFQDKDSFENIKDRLLKIDGISATLLPINTVGVGGDGRTYKHSVALSGKNNWDDLFFITKLIPKIFHNINRVSYVFGEGFKGDLRTITSTHLSKECIYQLQQADDIVNRLLQENNLIQQISQMPVILFPADFGIQGNRSIALRTFITNDFMTGVAAVPGIDIPEEVVEKMVSEILKNVKGISRVVYDLTSKPPGTTEWE